MSDLRVGAQLYTVREFTKTPKDIAETMKKVAKLGYKAVQLSALGPIDPKELKKITDAEGLYICATHISFERLQKELDAVIEEHKIWECPYVGVGSMPREFARDAEGFSRFAKEASEIAKKLKEAGLSFIYHNHAFEFRKLGNNIGMDILFSESDPQVFNMEIDTYWVQYGGGDPAAWIKKVKGRAPVVHFKDMTMGPERTQLMAEVGEGNLNWPAIIDACREAGTIWAVVEQDICQRDPFESLGISLNNLKAMGLQP